MSQAIIKLSADASQVDAAMAQAQNAVKKTQNQVKGLIKSTESLNGAVRGTAMAVANANDPVQAFQSAMNQLAGSLNISTKAMIGVGGAIGAVVTLGKAFMDQQARVEGFRKAVLDFSREVDGLKKTTSDAIAEKIQELDQITLGDLVMNVFTGGGTLAERQKQIDQLMRMYSVASKREGQALIESEKKRREEMVKQEAELRRRAEEERLRLVEQQAKAEEQRLKERIAAERLLRQSEMQSESRLLGFKIQSRERKIEDLKKHASDDALPDENRRAILQDLEVQQIMLLRLREKQLRQQNDMEIAAIRERGFKVTDEELDLRERAIRETIEAERQALAKERATLFATPESSKPAPRGGFSGPAVSRLQTIGGGALGAAGMISEQKITNRLLTEIKRQRNVAVLA